MHALTVYEMKNREMWQEIVDEMKRELGMFSALLDADHQILQTSGERNELCLAIISHESAKPIICGQSQQYMAEMARNEKTSVVEICEAGMAKLVVPIFHAQDYLGSLTACGALLPGGEVESFYIDKNTGMGEDTISKMAETAPLVKKERLQQAAEDIIRRLSDIG